MSRLKNNLEEAMDEFSRLNKIATRILEHKPKITELEYIQSTGTQYINTGVSFDVANCKAIIDFQFTSSTNERWCMGTNMDFEGGIYNGFYTGAGFTYSQTSSVLLRTIGTGNNIANNNLNIYLFARNWNGTVSGRANMKLYSCKMYKNNELIREFVPAKDKNDVVCLYDYVTEQYFYNAGTGEFIAR